MNRLGVALLGYGYWGKNLARNVQAHPSLSLSLVVDPLGDNLAACRDAYPAARLHDNAMQAIAEGDELDIVIIATPLATHYELAKFALECNKHVLVTKPLATTANEAAELVELAKAVDRVLMVDHTFVYTGSVQKLRELKDGGELGELVYCSSVRVNLGTYRRDSDVIWDLAPHDISILDAIGYGSPCAVAATGGGRMGGPSDQIAHLTLFYSDGFIAHINVSWLAPVKMRLMLFGGTKKMVVYDDVEPSEKVKVYDKGLKFDLVPPDQLGPLVEYRSGDMWAPKLDTIEAIYAELSHLVNCIQFDEIPITDGLSGLNAVRTLEGASRSAKSRGEVIVLEPSKWHSMALDLSGKVD